MSHTPGPWSFKWDLPAKNAEKLWAIVVDRNEGIIANVNTESGPDLPPLVSRKMPADANARLIAAAPDMLKALEAVADLMWDNDGLENTDEYALIEAAIAKAKPQNNEKEGE